MSSSRPQWGVFGGSFNPPHMGHQLLVQDLLGRGIVEKVLILPCFEHAFGKELCSLSLRCRWLDEIFEHDPRVEVSGLEASLGEQLGHAPRSLEILEHLAQTHPEVQLRWIVGQDIIDSGETARWYRWSEIQARFKPIVVPRAGYSKSSWLPQVSSSQIRRDWGQVQEDESSSLLPAVVQSSRDGRAWPPRDSRSLPEKVWVLGQGQAGRAILSWLRGQGIPAHGFSARQLAAQDSLLDQLATWEAPRMLWLATRPEQNPLLLERLRKRITFSFAPTWLVSSDGAYSAESLGLRSHCDAGLQAVSLHPICSLSGRGEALRKAYFGWSGPPAFAAFVREWLGQARLIDLCGLSKEDRLAYHAACALSSNYLGAMLHSAQQRWRSIGLDAQVSFPALAELMASALANLRALGIPHGVSGALARAQEEQVQCHQQQWEGADAALHAALVDSMRKALSSG